MKLSRTKPNYHKPYKITTNHTKLPKTIPNVPTFSIPRPHWYFWYENMPSGNPGLGNSCTLFPFHFERQDQLEKLLTTGEKPMIAASTFRN
jgi:hypothetical protein